MATKRTLSALIALFANNTDGNIGADDEQDFITSALGSMWLDTLTTGITLTTDHEVVLVDATSGALSETLPTAVGNNGKIYFVKKIDTTTNIVTLVPNGSQTIDGVTRAYLYYPGQSIFIISDNANWRTLAPSKGSPVLLFNQTDSVTVANTITESTILGTGSGSKTLKANSLRADSVLRIKIRGHITEDLTPTFAVAVKIGANTILTLNPTLPAALSNSLFEIEVELTFRSIGAGGTVIGQGKFITGTTIHPLVATGTTAANTTIDLAVDVTVDWGTQHVNNTVTSTNAWIDLVT